VPVGLYIQDCPRIREAFIFQEDDVILGVAGNVTETDTILAFIRMIYGIEN
jgi:predicted nucleotidyltransferase